MQRFCELDHVVVAPVGGDRQSLVSRALVQRGLERRVALRVPYFSTALQIVAESHLVATLPASLVPSTLAVREPPLSIPGFVLQSVWSERYDQNPLHRWLRTLVVQAAVDEHPDQPK